MSLKKPRNPPEYESLFDANEHLEQQPDAIQVFWSSVRSVPEDVKWECVRKLGHLGLRTQAPSTAENPSLVSDGPGPRFTFRWKGKMIRFDGAHLRFRLLVSLWDGDKIRPHEEREHEEVMDYVYGREHDTSGPGRVAGERVYVASDGAMRELCSKTRQALRDAGISVTIRMRAGKIWLQPL